MPDELPARELLARGLRTAACLLGTERRTCICLCGRQYHGALANIPIPGSAEEPKQLDLLAMEAT